MRLLVVGGAQVDAGKTTFSVGLVDRVGALGIKPRAGNDFWFDHDDYRRAVDAGRLYGKDAYRLAASSPGEYDPEDVNPVHRLWRPAPGNGAGLLGQDGREFLVDRVGERYVVNDTIDLPDSTREALDLSGAVRVASLPEFNEAMAEYHVPAQQRLLDRVGDAERLLVESYADVARPVRGFDPDAVAVVEPRRVRVYDGPRWTKACEVATGGPDSGQLEERVPAVTDLADPEASTTLPPLTDEQRSDPAAVAAAYESAYDRVIATAVE